MLRTNTVIGTQTWSYSHATIVHQTRNHVLLRDMVSRHDSNVYSSISISVDCPATLGTPIFSITSLVSVPTFRTVLRSIGGVNNDSWDAILNCNPTNDFTQSSGYSVNLTVSVNGVMHISKPIQIFNRNASIKLFGNVNNLMCNLIDPCLGEVGLVMSKVSDSSVGLQFRPANLELSLSWCNISAEIERPDNSLFHWVINYDSSEVGGTNVYCNDVLELLCLFEGKCLGQVGLNNIIPATFEQENRVTVPAISSEFQVSFIGTILFDGDGCSSTLHSRDGDYRIAIISDSEPHSSFVISNWNIGSSILFPSSINFPSCTFKELRWKSSIFSHTFIGQVV